MSKNPGFTGERFPELFDINAMPKQPEILKEGQLSEQLVRDFFEKGYVVLENYFKSEELEPCRDAISKAVEDLAQKLYKAGKIKDLYEDYGLFQRLTKMDDDFPGAAVIMHKLGKLPQAFRDLWSNERLLNLVEQLIGPDISGSPNWNLRSKTPHNIAMDAPWHQDSAYFDNSTYNILMPTVWIPFLDTNEQNGCMEIIEYGHRKGLVATHQCCAGGTWYVMLDENEMKKTLDIDVDKEKKLCPIPYGGMLLFNNIIPHRSLANLSNQVRWSIDLRFMKTGVHSGMFGLKEAVVLRSSKDPNMKIDWEKFDSVEKHKVHSKAVSDILVKPEDEEFDTTIQGAWMRKWEIVHMTHHVRKHQELNMDR